jgi:hypothetical protein
MWLTLCVGLWGACALGADLNSPQASARQMLDQKIEHFSTNAPLAEVIRQFSQQTGIRIEVDWPALQTTGVKADTPVVLKARQVSAAALLSLMLDQVSARNQPLAWRAEGDAVLVTTQMRLLSRETAIPRSSARRADRRAARPVGIDFSDAPLESVVAQFRQITGQSFFVNWDALEKVGLRRDTPVSLGLSNVAAARALDLLTEQLSASPDRYQKVYWVLDRGVITISTGEALDAQLHVWVCDISDLLAMPPHRDFSSLGRPQAGQTSTTPGTALGATGPQQPSATPSGTSRGGMRTSTIQEGAMLQVGGGTTGQAETAAAQGRDQHIQTLIRVIQGSIGQDMWQPEGKGAITVFNNHLIISQTLLGFKLMEDASRR